MPRPRSKVRRGKVLYAPVTEGEQREVHAAAGLKGLPIGEFVRLASLEVARKLLKRAAISRKLPR